MSIVRKNLMNEEGYTGYCGQAPEIEGGKICPGRWPRTVFVWKLKQFKCNACGWVSKYDEEFITEYIAKWKFTSETKFYPCRHG